MAAKKQPSVKWDEINRLVIGATDIEAAYRELGVDIAGSRPSASGWLSCRAMGREDATPSAAINVGDGPMRGRYRDLGGNGDSLSLFDFAAKYGSFADWSEARREYARKAGLLKKFPHGGDGVRVQDKLDFCGSWNRLLARDLVRAYPGITDEALQLCGGRLARYPAKSREPQYVVALPCYGPGGVDSEIKGYVLHAANGGKLKLWRGDDCPAEEVKRATIGQSGMLGRHGLKMLATEGVEVVWKVEGVSDLLALQAAIPPELRDTHLVITNAGGTHEFHMPAEFAPMLAGKRVAICHDCDEPGQQGAGKWLSILAPVSESVKNVVLPYPISPDHGQDLRDWLNRGGKYADLLAMLAEAPETVQNRELPPEGPNIVPAGENAATGQPAIAADAEQSPAFVKQSPTAVDIASEFAALTPEQQVLKRLGIIILGEIEGTKTIVAFSQRLAKVVEIKAVEKYKIENLIQDFGGDAVKAHVNLGEIPDPAKTSMAFVRQAIACEGGNRRITNADRLGAGVWEVSGRLLLVNHNEIVVLNGHLERSIVPAVDGKLVDLGGSVGNWFEFDELARLLTESESPDWCRGVFDEACEVFARWDNWQVDDTPQLVAALVCCTFLQTVWDWRPQVAVCGPSNSGKTMLFNECLKPLFGGLAMLSSKPTEAGLRQFLKNTAKAILIDEFEHDAHREKILELFRTSSRGSETIRGTAGQGGAKYGLKHIPWVAAIEVGLKRAPDRNRYIMLELGPVQGRGNGLTLPTAESLKALGLRLLVVAMRYWREAKTMASELKSRAFGSVDRRIVESYSLPCAMLGVVMGLDEDKSASLMQSVLSRRDQSEQSESDEAGLLHEIWQAKILMERGVTATVGEMLATEFVEPGWQDALQRHGIKRSVGDAGGNRIVFVKSMILKGLLRDSDFHNQDISQILIRVRGAKRDVRKISGKNTRVISIPEQEIHGLFNQGTPEDSRGLASVDTI